MVVRETIRITERMAPPYWALLERQLMRAMADAYQDFYERYFDERGFLLCVERWGGNDGPDDAMESLRRWPLRSLMILDGRASLKEIATNAPTRAPCAHAILICCQACRVFEGSRTQRTHGCVDLAEIFPSRLLDMPSADLAKSRPVSTAATKSRPRCALHYATLHYTRLPYPTLHYITRHYTALQYTTPH